MRCIGCRMWTLFSVSPRKFSKCETFSRNQLHLTFIFQAATSDPAVNKIDFRRISFGSEKIQIPRESFKRFGTFCRAKRRIIGSHSNSIEFRCDSIPTYFHSPGGSRVPRGFYRVPMLLHPNLVIQLCYGRTKKPTKNR